MKKETITINGRILYKTSHDKYKIKKVGTDEIYDEAIDVNPTEYVVTKNIKENKESENK